MPYLNLNFKIPNTRFEDILYIIYTYAQLWDRNTSFMS